MTRRTLRRALTLGAGVVMVTACSGSGSHAGRDPALANHAPDVLGKQVTRPTVIHVTTAEEAAFLEIALEPAVVTTTGRRPVLERWTRDATVRLLGDPTPEDLRHIDEALQRWSLITGRHLTMTGGAADITMRFLPRAEFAGALGVTQVDPTAVGLTRLRLDPHRGGVIGGATIVIADDDLQVARNRTIAHELGHSLGLQHSTCASSLMDGATADDRSVRWSPSVFDVRMGSLLYNPGLRPGMSAEQVRKVLVADAPAGATCVPVDLELVRAAGTDRHYFCARGPERVRPCTANTTVEPSLPITHPDAWTNGRTLTDRRGG